MDTAGDGFFAAFDGPARGIRCACAIIRGVRELGFEMGAGLRTGEVEPIGEKLGGIAVHIGARVAAEAATGEMLVSSTVKDLHCPSAARVPLEPVGPPEAGYTGHAAADGEAIRRVLQARADVRLACLPVRLRGRRAREPPERRGRGRVLIGASVAGGA